MDGGIVRDVPPYTHECSADAETDRWSDREMETGGAFYVAVMDGEMYGKVK